jgi:hypothetical protein
MSKWVCFLFVLIRKALFFLQYFKLFTSYYLPFK